MTRVPIFQGTCTAVITPFTKDGAVDHNTLQELLETQISADIDAICICGTTGEATTLSVREYISVIKTCVRTVQQRVKVIAGAGSNDTAKAVYLSQHAQDAGADALLIVTPYYNKPSQIGLIKHYEYICERVELPIILYNVPSRTGVSFTAQTYQELSKNPQFNGVKEASGNFSLITHTQAICEPDFTIWSGNDDLVVPMMSLGAKGVISVASNLIPKIMRDLSHLCLQNNFSTAAKLQLEYLPLIDELFSDTNPIPIKTAINLLNQKSDTPRLPLCELPNGKKEKLVEILHRYNLLCQ